MFRKEDFWRVLLRWCTEETAEGDLPSREIEIVRWLAPLFYELVEIYARQEINYLLKQLNIPRHLPVVTVARNELSVDALLQIPEIQNIVNYLKTLRE